MFSVQAHRFYKNHTDLGFPQLIKKAVLKDKKSGCIVNDTLTIEFIIEVMENSTCSLDGNISLSVHFIPY